jgi:streptomycin 3"-adenylyltransferase
LLVAIERPTTPEIRRLLVTELMRVSGRHPAKSGGPRPLEVIVFLKTDLTSSAYPARSEFLYGEWLRREFEAGAAPEPAADPDFTLVLAQARSRARTLIGPPPTDLLPIISDADVRRAIGDALPGLLGNLAGDERNVLLTLARMWHTLATGEFVPKHVAAEWAIPRLSAAAAALVALAKDAYLGTKSDDWRSRYREAQAAANELTHRVTAML